MGKKLKEIGLFLMRYSLVMVLVWIGCMKFTAYEAEGIQPFITNSPFLNWIYDFLSVRSFSTALGILEIFIAILIALRPFSREACAVGSALAVGMFLTTFSFIFTTPGWEPSLGGFPALSVAPGQFLLKDLVLLNVSIWSLGESIEK